MSENKDKSKDKSEGKSGTAGGKPGRPPMYSHAEVVRLYRDEGLSAYKINERLGITPAQVYAILKKDGVARRTNRKYDYGAIVEMYNSGEKTAEIARVCGTDHRTISMIITKLEGEGVEIKRRKTSYAWYAKRREQTEEEERQR